MFATLSGCPTPGMYGKICSLPCPQNCQQGRCDIVEGTCFGCIVGFKGAKCNKSNACFFWVFFDTISHFKENETFM